MSVRIRLDDAKLDVLCEQPLQRRPRHRAQRRETNDRKTGMSNEKNAKKTRSNGQVPCTDRPNGTPGLRVYI